MPQIKIELPKELNKLLRMFAVEWELGSKEKATIFILTDYLKSHYGIQKSIQKKDD